MEERTGWRGQDESQIVGEEKRNGRLVGAAETSKERAEWRRLQRKNLNILGWACRKGKSGLSATERAVGKNAGAALAKRKRNRAVCPEYQIMKGERVKMGESRTLARERGIRARVWGGKGGLHGERGQMYCIVQTIGLTVSLLRQNNSIPNTLGNSSRTTLLVRKTRNIFTSKL